MRSKRCAVRNQRITLRNEKGTGNSKLSKRLLGPLLETGKKRPIDHFHISHNAPYLPPKILHNLCFSFSLGITAAPREIENNICLCKIWVGSGGGGGWQIRCIMGNVEVANSWRGTSRLQITFSCLKWWIHTTRVFRFISPHPNRGDLHVISMEFLHSFPRRCVAGIHLLHSLTLRLKVGCFLRLGSAC